MKNSFIKKSLISLIAASSLISSTTVFAKTSFSGEYRPGEILSFGSSLTKNEELALREYFEVPDDMEAIYVDNATAIEQLGLAPDALDDYKGGWYSSAYVKLTEGGGVNIKSNNINLVTDEMFASALLTSGILSCDVTISAPFSVTGESALAGILAGIEEILGESLPEENKVVAKDEIDTTLDVADDILNNDNNDVSTTEDSANIASAIVNDVKQQVIKESPNSAEIEKIINDVTTEYGIELSEATQTRMLGLMEDVNSLDIDYNEIKDAMENIGSNISNALKEAGIKLQESGLLDKIFDAMKELVQNIVEWVQDIFGGNDATAEQPEPEQPDQVDPSDETTQPEVPSVNEETTEEQQPEVPSVDEETTEEQQPEVPSVDEETTQEQQPEVPSVDEETTEEDQSEVPAVDEEATEEQQAEAPAEGGQTTDQPAETDTNTQVN